MKYQMSKEVKFIVTDFGFVKPEYNNYVFYHNFIKLFEKYWTSKECKEFFQAKDIKVISPNDINSYYSDAFEVIIIDSEEEDIESLFNVQFKRGMFDLKIISVIEKEKQSKINYAKMLQKEQDIKDLKHIRWSISENDLPEKIQKSENWLEEKFHDGKIFLDLRNCVGEWLGENDVDIFLIDPTWRDLLVAINKAFEEFIKENGELDHIFLENIRPCDTLNGTPVFQCIFGS